MKLNILLLLAAATSAIAMPTPEPDLDSSELTARSGTCYQPSGCGRAWSGKCEDYCKGRGGFSHMTGDGCGFLSKKCCCNKKG